MSKSDEIAIKVTDVNKTFKLPHEKQNSIKGLFINIFSRNKTYEKQKALNNISFEIKKGEFFGIVGRNGSGKSTLLKLLAGIYSPDSGHIQVNGKLTPFIELGVGFSPELTGRENVFLNGALLGFNRKEMLAMYDEIVEFAELTRFMDQKLKNYSSGMQVRLAFSIAIRANTDILLIDEVLAVGDENFQKKCITIFEQLKSEGRTIVFVSHSMGQVKAFCDKVVVINDSNLIFDGNTSKAIDVYNKLNVSKEVANTKIGSKQNKEHFGTGGARILKYEIFDEDLKRTNILKTGKEFTCKIEVEYKKSVRNPIVCAMFRKNQSEDLFGLDNNTAGVKFSKKSKGNKSVITLSANMPLGSGEYTMAISVSDNRSVLDTENLDILDDALKVAVHSENEVWSIVSVPVTASEKAIT